MCSKALPLPKKTERFYLAGQTTAAVAIQSTRRTAWAHFLADDLGRVGSPDFCWMLPANVADSIVNSPAKVDFTMGINIKSVITHHTLVRPGVCVGIAEIGLEDPHLIRIIPDGKPIALHDQQLLDDLIKSVGILDPVRALFVPITTVLARSKVGL
jgi:hypothetical protein